MDAAPPEAKIADLVDLVHQAALTQETVTLPDGRVEIREILDHLTIWWKTHAVNSDHFARMATVVEHFRRLAKEAYRRMPVERAAIYEAQINEIVKVYMYSIDAKSSESKRDAHNAQAVLIDRAGRNKVEHVYKSEDGSHRSLADAFLGRRRQDDMDRDY